jgi:hypothetical protein
VSKQAVDVVQISSLGALVINGLTEGDRIVTSHLNQLREGMQVNSTTQEQAL